MSKPRKLPSGNWNIRVMVNGKSYSFTDPDKRTVKRMAAAFADQCREDIDNPKFIDAISDYIDRRTAVLSPASIRGYRSIEKMLRLRHAKLCQKRLIAVTDRDIQTVIDDLSSIWEDGAEEIPASRIDWLRQIWTAAHRSIKDICKDAGLTQRALAEYFGIPGRTIGNWATGERTCPDYTRIMMQELLGLVGREPIEYNLIYSVCGREEVVSHGSFADVSKAENNLRAVLRLNDPEGVESDCFIRSDAQLLADQRRKDLFDQLTDEEKHDYIVVDGRKYIRKIWEANNK